MYKNDRNKEKWRKERKHFDKKIHTRNIDNWGKNRDQRRNKKIRKTKTIEEKKTVNTETSVEIITSIEEKKTHVEQSKCRNKE